MGEVITNFIVEYQKGIFIFCGLYLIWGSLRNFDWFNGHRFVFGVKEASYTVH